MGEKLKIEKYQDAFDLIFVPHTDKAKYYIKQLEQEGYREKNICYAIWKSQDKLLQFRSDDRFWNIFMNEIRKIAFKNNYI
jgi:hypothetical protein